MRKPKVVKIDRGAFKTPAVLVQYLRVKRIDDLRMHDALHVGKSTISVGSEVAAARKALSYLDGWHPEISNVHYSDILLDVGYENKVVAEAAREVR